MSLITRPDLNDLFIQQANRTHEAAKAFGAAMLDLDFRLQEAQVHALNIAGTTRDDPATQAIAEQRLITLRRLPATGGEDSRAKRREAVTTTISTARTQLQATLDALRVMEEAATTELDTLDHLPVLV